MAEDYAHGRRDGLRLALGILAAQRRNGRPCSEIVRRGGTNAIRAVRHKTLQVGERRVQTALNRLTLKAGPAMDVELAPTLKRAGL